MMMIHLFRASLDLNTSNNILFKKVDILQMRQRTYQVYGQNLMVVVKSGNCKIGKNNWCPNVLR